MDYMFLKSGINDISDDEFIEGMKKYTKIFRHAFSARFVNLYIIKLYYYTFIFIYLISTLFTSHLI